MSKYLANKKIIVSSIGLLLILLSVFFIGKNFYYKGLISGCFNKEKEINIYGCIQEVALSRGFPGICNLIKDTEEIYSVGLLGPNGYSITKNGCYLRLAERKKNINLCNKINDNEIKINCQSRVAKSDADLSICEKIRDSEKKEWCIQGVASELVNYSLCEKLTYKNIKDTCFEYIAPKIIDGALCAKIDNQQKKDSCYCETSWASDNLDLKIELVEKIKQKTMFNHRCILPIVKENKNLELCEMIYDQNFKKDCLSIK